MQNDAPTNTNLFAPWFEDCECSIDGVRVLRENKGGRDKVFKALVTAAADHLVGLKVIESLGGFPNATHLLKNRIPQRKIARSGMLGEILATEYLDQETEFTAPVRRLRHRDTRELAMRGDDVIGIANIKSRVRVMKVEAKSRSTLATTTVNEAREGLAKHEGRPNPETLAFIECILRETGRDVEAEPLTSLQSQTLKARDCCHLLFTLSGNNPTNFLEGNSAKVTRGIELRLCGCRVGKHGEFIKQVFDACVAQGEADGIA